MCVLRDKPKNWITSEIQVTFLTTNKHTLVEIACFDTSTHARLTYEPCAICGSDCMEQHTIHVRIFTAEGDMKVLLLNCDPNLQQPSTHTFAGLVEVQHSNICRCMRKSFHRLQTQRTTYCNKPKCGSTSAQPKLLPLPAVVLYPRRKRQPSSRDL